MTDTIRKAIEDLKDWGISCQKSADTLCMHPNEPVEDILAVCEALKIAVESLEEVVNVSEEEKLMNDSQKLIGRRGMCAMALTRMAEIFEEKK